MNLIIGNGLIGRHLYYNLRGDGVLLTRKEVDLSKDSWELPKCKVAYICAGKSSTIECEENPEETRLINVTNTIKLANVLKPAHVVWISSERVYDGGKPYKEVGDEVCPTTEYGKQKAETENVLLNEGATVIRFSKVIGWDMPLLEGWISELRKDLPIFPYSNVGMSPMPVSFVVKVLSGLSNSGLFQISGDEDISYSGIAYYLAICLKKDLGLVRPVLSEKPHPYTTLKSNIAIDTPSSWKTIRDWCEQRI